MPDNDVFIAFSNKKTAAAIAKIALSGGFNVAAAVTTAASLKKYIGFYEGGIVICGCRFSDDNINTLAEEIPECFGLIVLGDPEQLGYCDVGRAVKLTVPITAADMLAYMDMVRPAEIRRSTKRPPKDRAIIDKAKRYLISRYGMTEPQAHRFLEKKSMETGRSMTDIAKKIVG